jgi:hypothetical protein
VAGNRQGTFVCTIEADRWHKEAEQLESCTCIVEYKNEEVWNYERWGTKTVTSV